MKTMTILTVLFVSFTIISCEDIIPDQNLNTSIVEEIPIHLDAESKEKMVDESITLSLDNDDTHDYLDKINDVTITKLTFKIIDFIGNETADVEGEFFINNDLLLQEDIVIQTAYSDQIIYEITDVDKLDSIASSLKEEQQIDASFKGKYNSVVESNFNIEVTLELDLKATIL